MALNPYSSTDPTVVNFITAQNSGSAGRGGSGQFSPAIENNGIAGTATDNVVGLASLLGVKSMVSLGSGFNTVIVDGFNSQLAAAGGQPDNVSFSVDTAGNVTLTDSNTHQTATVSGVSFLIFDGAAQGSDSTYESIFFIGNAQQSEILRLYAAAFGRQPDLGGLEFYANALNAGTSFQTVAAEFMGSSEFQARYGANVSDSQFIVNLYQNVLHRTPSSSEIAYYQAALTNYENGVAGTDTNPSWSRAQELLNFANSTEDQNNVASFSINTAGTANNGVVYATPAPSFTLSHDTQAAVSAGGTETFSLATAGVAPGTVFYYTLSGVTASEVAGGALSGTITVGGNGSATLPVTFTTTGGSLSGAIIASLSTTSGGNVVASASEPLSGGIAATTPSYSLSHDSQSSVTEGGTETFTVTTSNVAVGTALYYSLTGVTSSEVVGGVLSGSVTIGAGGTAVIAVPLTATPGQGLSGALTASLSTTPGGTPVASASEPLAETTTSNQSYALAAGSQSAVTEGGTETFTLTTAGVAIGTTLYYALTGVTAAEVSGGALSGTLTIGADGTASLPVALTSTLGQGLSGDLTATISSTRGGTTLATASVALAETPASVSVTELAIPGLASSQAQAIDDAGQIIVYSPANFQSYQWTNGIISSLSPLGQGWAVNDASQPTIAGSIANTTTGGTDAGIWRNGAATDLGNLGGGYAFAYGVNASGVVVGVSETASAAFHAFEYAGGSMVDLGTLGGTTSSATGINDAGQVVGSSTTASGSQHAFLWVNGTMTDLGTLGGATSAAYAINNQGQVVGNASTSSGLTAAFLWQNGTMTSLGTLGGALSTADALNNHGQIVGYFLTSGGVYHAFLWQGGVMTDLNQLLPAGSGWVLNQATGINDSGQIVGFGTFGGGTEGFELTVPPAGATHATLIGISPNDIIH